MTTITPYVPFDVFVAADPPDNHSSYTDAVAVVAAGVNVPATLAWLNTLPVYSGSGPAPVPTGSWFINAGKLEQAG